MTAFLDIMLLLIVKVILIVAFIFLLKKWLSKTKSIIPIVLYWLLGFVFALLIPFTIIEWFLNMFFLNENHVLLNHNSLATISSLLSFLFYILIGLKLFTRNRYKNEN